MRRVTSRTGIESNTRVGLASRRGLDAIAVLGATAVSAGAVMGALLPTAAAAVLEPLPQPRPAGAVVGATLGVELGLRRLDQPELLDVERDAADDGANSGAAEATESASEPELRLEVGRSPTRAGFALDIAGGAPHGWALLELSTAGSPQVRELVRLDENGAARVLRLSHESDAPIEVVCSIPRGMGADGPAPGAYPSVTRRAIVPGAGAMIADSRAKLGWGAPRSPFAALGSGASGLVITEIMKDPTTVADTAGEWFEVRNLGSTPIDVSGWRIRDAGSNNHLIPASAGVVIPPRSYFVFGINANPALNGGVNVGYKYSSFTLANGADDIQLLDASGLLVDAVAYDAGVFWPSTPGKALNLNRALVDTLLNDDGANWCSALSPISASNPDTGTPRIANNNCP